MPHMSPYIRFCSCQLNSAALLQKKTETDNRFTEAHSVRSLLAAVDCSVFLRLPVRSSVDHYSAPVKRERSIVIGLSVCLSVCLSASISLELRDQSSQNFVCRSPLAMARSSSAGVAVHYVLLVLWMTPRSAVLGRMVMRRRLNL